MTLKDIAREAGVSVMTVSNVINKNFTRVSDDTVKRVMSIIKKHNYVPNLYARSLSAKKSNIVAILIPSHDYQPINMLEDPYNQQMIGNIELALRKSGYFVMLRSYSGAKEAISVFKHWNIAGAIMFYPLLSEPDMKTVLEAGVPVVLIDRYYQNLKTYTVDLDDFSGGYLAGKFLISNGHRRLAYVCPYNKPSLVVKHRIMGFNSALKEIGLRLTSELFFNVHGTFESGMEAGKKIASLKEPPTAVATTIDRVAIGVMEGLRLRGIKVPEDISVVGFDNWPVLQYVNPKITTISQDFTLKSHEIAKMLTELMEGKIPPEHHITLGVDLIERQSVRCIT